MAAVEEIAVAATAIVAAASDKYNAPETASRKTGSAFEACLFLNSLMSTFLLSYFPTFLQFGNKFLVVAAHSTLDSFVCKQSFQSLLP